MRRSNEVLTSVICVEIIVTSVGLSAKCLELRELKKSYHSGHVQGSTSLGTAGFVGLTEGSGALDIMDSYSIGSSNGNGVIGVNQPASNVTLNQPLCRRFYWGNPSLQVRQGSM